MKPQFLHSLAARLLAGRPMGLRTRISLVLTLLAAGFMLLLAVFWQHSTRHAIREELEAGGKVSAQMLAALSRNVASPEQLLSVVRPLGRVRAHEIEIFSPDGALQYRSPASAYKAGRDAPEWFADWLRPDLQPNAIPVGSWRLVLRPDPSRSLVDAWDEARVMIGWAVGFLIAVFSVIRFALARALHPLDQVKQALDGMARGRFDARLPVFAPPELSRLSRAYNAMADRLGAAIDENVRLETRRLLAEQIQSRLETERREIARELHDELAQGVTAVRALAGAIVQRTGEQPALHGHAQAIVAVTGEMQDGVRNILKRLRPSGAICLSGRLQALGDAWCSRHGDIALETRLSLEDAAVSDDVAQIVLRVVQEGLTNVVRHAGATHVLLVLRRSSSGLELLLSDNGRGQSGSGSRSSAAFPGSGLGLAGMLERVQAAGGQLSFYTPAGGGFALTARLPMHIEEMQ